MDRLARPKDDLFDNSTMTFGEHLEELRGSLVKAILWLAGGMLIGLSAKNAILIVEFAKVESEKGRDAIEAAMEATGLVIYRFFP